jgi:acyl carrier protein
MEKIKKLVSEVLMLPTAQVHDALSMKTTESWDSLKHMELIATIEQDYGIELTMDDIVAMGSFKGITDVLAKKGVAL